MVRSNLQAAALFHLLEHGANSTLGSDGAPRRDLCRGLAFERGVARAGRPGHATVARCGDPARFLAAQRSAGQRHRSRADEADPRVGTHCSVRTASATAATFARRCRFSPSVDGRGWGKTDVGGPWRLILRCWARGCDLQRDRLATAMTLYRGGLQANRVARRRRFPMFTDGDVNVAAEPCQQAHQALDRHVAKLPIEQP